MQPVVVEELWQCASTDAMTRGSPGMPHPYADLAEPMVTGEGLLKTRPGAIIWVPAWIALYALNPGDATARPARRHRDGL